MDKRENYCKICGKYIPDRDSNKCRENCVSKLEDVSVMEITKPGSTVWFYQSPEGDFLHHIWPNGIGEDGLTHDVAPTTMKQYDKTVEEADEPGYGYDFVEISDTPLDEIAGETVDSCT